MKPNGLVLLSERQAQIVSRVLSAHQGRIGEVKVYGSRATGRARPGSDLDLVIFPPVTDRDLTHLLAAFEESDLPLWVDLVAWDRIESDRLRQEIERDAIPFFEPSIA